MKNVRGKDGKVVKKKVQESKIKVFAFAKFINEQDAKMAIDKTGVDFQGSMLLIKLADEREAERQLDRKLAEYSKKDIKQKVK
jgi:RNA recognition motif-containing protein